MIYTMTVFPGILRFLLSFFHFYVVHLYLFILSGMWVQIQAQFHFLCACMWRPGVDVRNQILPLAAGQYSHTL